MKARAYFRIRRDVKLLQTLLVNRMVYYTHDAYLSLCGDGVSTIHFYMSAGEHPHLVR
jgi:hypothetical protein